MTSHSTVGVDNDLAARETGVTNRASDHEAPGRVDDQLEVVVGEPFRNNRPDHVLDQIGPDHGFTVNAVVVLGGHQHSAESDRTIVLVVEGDLGLPVRPQVRDGAGPAHLGMALGHPMGQVDGQRHQGVGLVAGVAEHHSLVPGALPVQVILLSGGPRPDLLGVIDPLSDVVGLGVDSDHHPTSVAVKAIVLPVVSDLSDRPAHDVGDVYVPGGSDFAGHYAEAGGEHRLAGHPRLGIFGQERVEDGVRNLVGHLVRMSLGDRLRGERPDAAHRSSLSIYRAPS